MSAYMTTVENFERLTKGLRCMMADLSPKKSVEPPADSNRIAMGSVKRDYSYPSDPDRVIADDVPLDKANLVTSRLGELNEWGEQRHRIVLDIDYDAALIPSSTPGHHHLILDKTLSWPSYRSLLQILGEFDIVEENYAKVSIQKGYSAIRPPWVQKEVEA